MVIWKVRKKKQIQHDDTKAKKENTITAANDSYKTCNNKNACTVIDLVNEKEEQDWRQSSTLAFRSNNVAEV